LLKQALLHGKSAAVVQAEFQKQGISQEEAKFLLPFKVLQGNKPTNTILIDISTKTIGSLIAMYEHKILCKELSGISLALISGVLNSESSLQTLF
jgi:glucose-6-phosphate isomerase